MTWRGDEYQQRFDALAASGADVHGEADFVMRYQPASVLDAGCGTGRVAIELAARAVDVVGVDASESMIATARQRAPHLEWHVALVDGDLDLGRTFDVVVMAGNVPLFTPPGTLAALVRGCARHVRAGGLLVAGFQLDGRVSVDAYDTAAHDAGLQLEARYATWDGDPFDGEGGEGGDYAVSVHRAG